MGNKYSHIDSNNEFICTKEDFQLLLKKYNKYSQMNSHEIHLYHGINILMKSKFNSKIYCNYKDYLFRHKNKQSNAKMLRLATANEEKKNKFIKGYKKVMNF